MVDDALSDDGAQAEVDKHQRDRDENRITEGEQYNKNVDTWSRVTDVSVSAAQCTAQPGFGSS